MIAYIPRAPISRKLIGRPTRKHLIALRQSRMPIPPRDGRIDGRRIVHAFATVVAEGIHSLLLRVLLRDLRGDAFRSSLGLASYIWLLHTPAQPGHRAARLLIQQSKVDLLVRHLGDPAFHPSRTL